MKKKTLLLIVACTVVSLSTVTTLFVLSEDLTHTMNSFHRIIPPHSISEVASMDVDLKQGYISGVTDHTVYLTTFTEPRDLHIFNVDSLSYRKTTLVIHDLAQHPDRFLRVRIDSPDVYVTDGVAPAILKGNLQDGIARRFTYDSVFFSKVVRIGPKSFVVRSRSTSSEDFVLGKVQFANPHATLKEDLLKKQREGVFSLDGMLNYDKESGKVVYSYAYRNQFIVTDTSLNLLYVSKTIDTVSTARIRTGSINGKITEMNAPPLVVNKLSYAAGGFLFVNSNLMANNDKRDVFDRNSAIDVYDLKDGSYRLSIYVGDDEGGKLHDFRVHDNRLIAWIGSKIRIYQLFNYFKVDTDLQKNVR